MSYTTVDFTTNDAGKTVGTAVAPAGVTLNPGDQLSINGSTDLGAIIVGNSNAAVSSILYVNYPEGFYVHNLAVTGQGPAGVGSGSLVITIIDGEGGSHSLKLDSSTDKTHDLGFDSKNGAINTISWAPGIE